MILWLNALSSGPMVTSPPWPWTEVVWPSGTTDAVASLLTSELPLGLFFPTLKDSTCSQLDSCIDPSYRNPSFHHFVPSVSD